LSGIAAHVAMFFFKNIGIRAAAARRRRITGSAWKNFPGTAHTDRQTDIVTLIYKIGSPKNFGDF
jgi:hypothetical protein